MENEELIKHASNDFVEISRFSAYKEMFDKFNQITGKKPVKQAIKKNKYANNSDFLEIGYYEMKLDQLFLGLWSVDNLKWEMVANSICVSLEVKIFHPIAQAWITRAGVGACDIQLESGSKVLSPETIKSKALEKNFPTAKAIAFKNACKSFGNIFGRHLNREFHFDFIPDKKSFEGIFEEEANVEAIVKIEKLISESNLSPEEKTDLETTLAEGISKLDAEKIIKNLESFKT